MSGPASPPIRLFVARAAMNAANVKDLAAALRRRLASPVDEPGHSVGLLRAAGTLDDTVARLTLDGDAPLPPPASRWGITAAAAARPPGPQAPHPANPYSHLSTPPRELEDALGELRALVRELPEYTAALQRELPAAGAVPLAKVPNWSVHGMLHGRFRRTRCSLCSRQAGCSCRTKAGRACWWRQASPRRALHAPHCAVLALHCVHEAAPAP